MPTNLEQTILRNLLTDEGYMRKVLPFIKPDYFEGIYRILFREAGKFVSKYNKLPNAESFKAELKKIPAHRYGDENDMAGVAVMLCSRAGAYFHGETLNLDGGYRLTF